MATTLAKLRAGVQSAIRGARSSNLVKRSLSFSAHNDVARSSMDTNSDVGFIGMGNMGSHMAMNLFTSGFRVSVHDINRAAVQPFLDRGVPVKETPMEIAEASDVVITMLPSSAHVARRSPYMLDAPVSGGILAAEAGSLTFMVGGTQEAYLAAEPLFHSMGRASIYCGGAGNGSVAKICNNLAMAISMIGVSEALAIGQSQGIAASTLSSIFNCSSARCWSSDTYNPVPGVMDGVPSSRNYQGGFASKLMAKDLDLAAVSAKEAGVKHPLTIQAQEIYHELCNESNSAKDFSCIFRHYYGGKDEPLKD